MSPIDPPHPNGPALDIRVRVLQPPTFGIPGGQAYRALLLAWCQVNKLETDRIAAREIRANLTARTITYWRPLEQDDALLPGEQPWSGRHTQWRQETRPLLVDPAGYLAGEVTCGYLERYGEALMTCGVGVSPSAEHPGTHRDEHSDVEWLNPHPGVLTYRDGRPDVSGGTPDRAHVLTLTALEHLDRRPQAGRRSVDDLEVQAGRIRIAYRHAPAAAGDGTWRCSGPHAHAAWPCDDYLDATAGSVSGLDTYR